MEILRKTTKNSIRITGVLVYIRPGTSRIRIRSVNHSTKKLEFLVREHQVVNMVNRTRIMKYILEEYALGSRHN
jgi:hypothetical protein